MHLTNEIIINELSFNFKITFSLLLLLINNQLKTYYYEK